MVIGKVVLVVNKLAVLRKFDGKPLVYPILFKSTVYTFFVLLVRLLEHWVPAFIETGSLSGATDYMSEHVVWRFFAMGQIWIFVLFLAYTTAAEFVAVFGLTARQLLTAFFKDHPARLRPTI